MPNKMMQFFAYDHLKEPLKSVSKKFGDLAKEMDEYLPENPEKTVALRKLLEAKDCAVRAVFYKDEVPAEAGEAKPSEEKAA